MFPTGTDLLHEFRALDAERFCSIRNILTVYQTYSLLVHEVVVEVVDTGCWTVLTHARGT